MAGLDPPPGALDSTLRRLLADARAAWPAIELDDDTFVRYLAERLPAGEDREAALAGLHVGDLFLACACVQQIPSAIAALERAFLGDLRAALSAIQGASPDFADEVRQVLRSKLLFDESRTPRIASYAGQGPLGAWIRVAALRVALDLVRQHQALDRKEISDEHLLEVPSPVGDPELQHLKARYAPEFRAAFAAAVAALPRRERTVLRLHYLDDLTVEKIGVVYHVHGSTISRWIAHARTTLFEETRRVLMERLALDTAELDSVLQLVQSQLDVSLGVLLASVRK